MVHSSRGFQHHVHAPYPCQGLDPRESSGRLRWTPIRGRGSHTKQSQSSFVPCLINLDRSSHPRMVSSSSRIMSPSSSVFLVPT